MELETATDVKKLDVRKRTAKKADSGMLALGRMMMKQHKRIWLQTEHEATGEMTWCEDKINDDDVEYVRGDLFAQLEAENEAWFELCRFFVGGSDEHILIMRNTYLLTAEEEEDE